MRVKLSQNDGSEVPNVKKMTSIDPNFVYAGKKLGLQIWRIQNSKPVLYPKSEYGKFHPGDSYVILNTGLSGNQFVWIGHYWLGKETSENEAMSAANLANQLNAKLGSLMQLYRETQDNESELFLSYFKNGIRYVQDSKKSRFQQTEIDSSKPEKLRQKRRKRSPEVVNDVPDDHEHKKAKDIFHAAKDGDLESVKYFLNEEHIPVDEILIATGETPLLKAAQACHFDVIEFLVNSGANVHHRDKWGYTALHWAADQYEIHLNVIEFLVSHGADVRLQDDVKGYTPLHWAAYHCNLDAVKFLLSKGADTHSKSRTEETPIDLAAHNGCLNVVEYFIKEKSANLDIFDAAQRGYTDTVKYLIEKKGKPATATDSSGWTLLHRAAYDGRLDIVKYLVERKKVNVNVKNKDNKNPATPLHAAIEKGHLNVVKYLVEKNADIKAKDSDGRTPLYWAAENGFLDVIKFFVDTKKADIGQKDKHGNTLLHAAAWNGNQRVIKFLVEEKGADVNVKNDDGNTPLSVALQRDGSFEVFQYLLRDKGADFKTKDNHGNTPLHMAAQKGYLDVVKYLVEHDADFKAKNADGQTPVYWAFENGYLDVAKFFVDDMKADYNERDDQGRTLLHAAAHSGNVLLVKYLAEDKGIEVDTKDAKGTTPLAEAHDSKKLDIVEYLESKTVRRSRRSIEDSVSDGTTRSYQSTDTPANNSAYTSPSWIGGLVDWTSKSFSALALPPAEQDGVAVLPAASNAVVDGIAILFDVGVRMLTGNNYKQPVNDSLLSPAELIERRIDNNVTSAIDELSVAYNELSSE